jgi:molybdopterin-biosynthesis enzyme MoeA-like protein
MKGIFTEEIEPAFLAGGAAASVRELRFNFAVESRFYELMRELEASHPDVSVGSYPNFDTKELVIRVLGADSVQVEQVAAVIARRAAALRMS